MVRWWWALAWVRQCAGASEGGAFSEVVLLIQTPRYERAPIVLRYEPLSFGVVFVVDPKPHDAPFPRWCREETLACVSSAGMTLQVGVARWTAELATYFATPGERAVQHEWIGNLVKRRALRGLGNDRAPAGVLYLHFDMWLNPNDDKWARMRLDHFWRLGFGLRRVPTLAMEMRGFCRACDREWMDANNPKTPSERAMGAFMAVVDAARAERQRAGAARCAVCIGWMDLYYIPLGHAALWHRLMLSLEGAFHETALPTGFAAVHNNRLAAVDFIACAGCCCGAIGNPAIFPQHQCGHRINLGEAKARVAWRKTLDDYATAHDLDATGVTRRAVRAVEDTLVPDVVLDSEGWAGGCYVIGPNGRDTQLFHLSYDANDPKTLEHFRAGCAWPYRFPDQWKTHPKPDSLLEPFERSVRLLQKDELPTNRSVHAHFHEPCEGPWASFVPDHRRLEDGTGTGDDPLWPSHAINNATSW